MRATTGMGMNIPTVSFGGTTSSTNLPPPQRGPQKDLSKQSGSSSHQPGYALDIHLGAYIPWGMRGMLLPEIGYSLDAPRFPGKFSLGVGFLFAFPNTLSFAVTPSALGLAYSPALLLAYADDSYIYGGLRNALRFHFYRYWYIEAQHEVLIGATGLSQNVRLMFGFDFGLFWSAQTWVRAINGMLRGFQNPR